MAEAGWGTVTEKGKGGGSADPNVLKLGDSTRIRVLEPTARRWRQHFIESSSDPDQGRSVVCPKGPDGRDQMPCPCCMKPVDEKGKQRFSISRRFATNVWDYESESVKVLIAGPQVFDEFDADAKLGMDPTATDYIIFKSGKGTQTSYKVRRGDPGAGPTVGPDDLHDLSKYDTPTSAEKILELMEEMGIDYDSLEMPSFTLEEAEKFTIPYGKHKGQTIEWLVANEQDYCEYLHNAKKEQGNYGDPVFVALQVCLEDIGAVEALDQMPTTPPKPAQASPAPSPATESAPADPDVITLIGPDGKPQEVPALAKDALLQAGYTEPQPDEPAEEPAGEPDIDANGNHGVSKDGQTIYVPEAAVEAMLSQGYARVFRGAPAQAAPAEPAYQLPGDDDEVQFKLNVVPAPVAMAFKDAVRLANDGEGTFVDEQLAAAVDKLDTKGVQQEVAAAAAADPSPPDGADPLDPDLMAQNDDGRWTHPALDKDYAAKGGVTQALNRLRNKSGDTPPAASNGAATNGTGKDAKLETAKALLAGREDLTKDFQSMLDLFQKVAGKRNITEFSEQDLDNLITELQTTAA